MHNFPVWLFGLPNSGKTTLAMALSERLNRDHIKHEYLDGDRVRGFFGKTIGYTPEERRRNIHNIIFGTYLLDKHGIPVIVANVLPFEDMRRELRTKIPHVRLVFVKASMETCMKRDAEKKALHGTENTFGKTISFDEPVHTDLILDTDRESVDESFSRLCAFMGLKH